MPYVANRDMDIDHEGQLVHVAAGTVVPGFDGWPTRDALLRLGRVQHVPEDVWAERQKANQPAPTPAEPPPPATPPAPPTPPAPAPTAVAEPTPPKRPRAPQQAARRRAQSRKVA